MLQTRARAERSEFPWLSQWQAEVRPSTMKDAPPGVKINQEEVRWEDFEQRLAQIYLKRAEKVAFVRGDSDIDFRYVADVIDLAYHAGVQRIGLLTDGQEVEGE